MSTTTEQASRSRRRAAKSIALTLGMVLLAALAAAPRAQAQTYNVLYNFTNGTDGGVPNGSLIQDKAGSFYGTTYQGAGSGCGGSGCGTVFKLTKTGTLTTLYTFTGGSDGGNPQAGVILSGNTLYGTTTYGGNLNCNIYNGSGCGVVFKLNIETGAETVLYSFTGGADGGVPGMQAWSGTTRATFTAPPRSAAAVSQFAPSGAEWCTRWTPMRRRKPCSTPSRARTALIRTGV